MGRIHDENYARKLIELLKIREDPHSPDELEELVQLTFDINDLLGTPIRRSVSLDAVTIVGGVPIAPAPSPTAVGDLFTTDPADTVNQTQDLTVAAGGAGVFSAAGFKVAARALLPTRLDLVDFFLRPSVDAQIGVALETFTAAFAGKNLVNADLSARSGVVDVVTTGGSKRAVVSGAAEANVRFWIPFHAGGTVFRWSPPNPEFRFNPGALVQGLRVMAVADVANTAIRVQWGVIWRQTPTP